MSDVKLEEVGDTVSFVMSFRVTFTAGLRGRPIPLSSMKTNVFHCIVVPGSIVLGGSLIPSPAVKGLT